MSDVNARFQGSIPEHYDRHLGPVIFEPFAADLARRVSVQAPGSLLEIACGTGILTAELRARLDPDVHLLATGYSRGAISLTMRDVGRCYVQYVNGEYERTGTLYEGRFKSSLVETRPYFLTCMRYIELNPVRASMVGHPAEYPWSSFGQNASGEPSGLVVAHAEYLQLGGDPQSRGETYRRLFDNAISDDQLAAIPGYLLLHR